MAKDGNTITIFCEVVRRNLEPIQAWMDFRMNNMTDMT